MFGTECGLCAAVVDGAGEEDGEGLGKGGCACSWETGADDADSCAGLREGWLLTHCEK